MRSLSKKSVKERRLIKPAIFICLMFIAVFVSMVLARGEPVKAVSSFKAFSWGTREKFFTLLDTGGESGAPKYSLYHANFKRGNSTIYLANGGTIDLKERCDNKKSDDDDNVAPYRYWFWVKANYQHTTSITWRTDSYIATGWPVDGSNYNAKQYENSEDVVSVAIDRKSARSHNNSFFVSSGRTVDGYGLDFYLIDIKEWYNRGGAEDDGFYGYLYMQSVIGVYHSGRHYSGPYYTLSSWTNAEGWANSSEFCNHYNQVLHIDASGKHDTYFYRVVANKDRPKYGRCNPDDGKDVVLSGTGERGGVCKYKVRNYSAFQLKDIETYKCDGWTYYLKGIAVYPHGVTIDDRGNPQRSFYLTNSVGEELFGDDGDKKTGKYSKVNGAGAEKDYLSGRTYSLTNAMEFSGATKKFKKQNVQQGSYGGNARINPKPLEGQQKVKTIRKQMEKLWFKSGCEAQDVYLVYEARVVPAKLTVTAEYYDHDDDAASEGTEMSNYVSVEKKDPKDIGKLTGNDNKFNLKTARNKEKEKILEDDFKGIDYGSLTGADKKATDQKIDEKRALNTFSEYNGVMYTARSVVVSYTNTSGNESYVYLNGSSLTKSGDEPGVADTSFDAVVKSASSNKFEDAVWSGKTDERGELLTAIGKALNKIEITDMDKSKDVDVHVNYYQPKLPVMKLSYLKFKDKTGKSHSVLISADKEEDLKETFRNNGNSAGDTLKFGSYGYDLSVTAYKDPATEMLYLASDLGSSGTSGYEEVDVPLDNAFAIRGSVEGYHGQTSDAWIGSDGKPIYNVIDYCS